MYCVQQLRELRPRAGEFGKAGIRIVTIGLDEVDKVRASIQSRVEGGQDPLPFPILCDPKAEVFKRYRCWDDFAKTALHGSFLLDAEGRVRWRDRSFEPFRDIDFLLRETKRLFAGARR